MALGAVASSGRPAADLYGTCIPYKPPALARLRNLGRAIKPVGRSRAHCAGEVPAALKARKSAVTRRASCGLGGNPHGARQRQLAGILLDQERFDVRVSRLRQFTKSLELLRDALACALRAVVAPRRQMIANVADEGDVTSVVCELTAGDIDRYA